MCGVRGAAWLSVAGVVNGYDADLPTATPSSSTRTLEMKSTLVRSASEGTREPTMTISPDTSIPRKLEVKTPRCIEKMEAPKSSSLCTD